jgi:2'-hydroxyisoflavone reductase
MTTRRDFLVTTSAALALSALPTSLRGQASSAPLKILILGGTGYIGPHLVRHAVSRGHSITTFTRGRRNPELPEGIERLVGDRNGQLDALKGKSWDIVFDDYATNPDWVRQSTELLKGSVGRYLFTSSTGVYYPYLKRGYDENDAPHLEQADPQDGSETFGVNKAKCEAQVKKVFGPMSVVVRPTYIIGPGDTSDRFPYWPVRLQKGGEVLAPGKKDDPVAFIDVRDLAEFMVRLAENNNTGIYNVVGPRNVMTSREFYEKARAAINPSVQYVYVDDYDFLDAHKIESSVPWVILKDKDFGHQSIQNKKVIAAGLGFRPIEQTLKDTLAWWPSVPEARRNAPRWAISAETEAKALAAWKARG